MNISFEDLESIDGWFHRVDFDTLRVVADIQRERVTGDIVEVGCFQGRCSILLASFLRAEESLRVVDLFGLAASEEENRREVELSPYEDLSKELFLANFAMFHEREPRITIGESEVLLGDLDPGSVRLAHIDGSHTYGVVHADLLSVKKAMAPGGVIVIDDYRTFHAPGVAAAAWSLVAQLVLVPFALTPYKLYATTSNQIDFGSAVEEPLKGRGYQTDWHVLPGPSRAIRVFGEGA